MIFPDLFDDELIYGIIARLADRMGLTNIELLSRYVFGRGKVEPSPLGVPKIALMIPRLLPGSPYTGHLLVARHSLIPYYTAFRRGHPTDSVATRLMTANRWATIGLTGRIPSPLGLRFCRRCVAESLAQGQEPFRSRSHQLPGFSVCHRHLCRLEEGTTPASDARTTYLSLARVIAEAHPTRENIVQAPSDIVAEVALFSHDLITADLSSRLANAAESFFGLLGDRGWRYQARRDALSLARLKERVFERFGADIVKDLGIEHFWYGSAADIHPNEGSTRWICDTMAQKGRLPTRPAATRAAPSVPACQATARALRPPPRPDRRRPGRFRRRARSPGRAGPPHLGVAQALRRLRCVSRQRSAGGHATAPGP